MKLNIESVIVENMVALDLDQFRAVAVGGVEGRTGTGALPKRPAEWTHRKRRGLCAFSRYSFLSVRRLRTM